mmetsp:Transcript_43945/g.139307  ORF Transcript_43945/g.139307 Transcript_43945/m.139307 type:complete len:267 (-) Transcript_43945:275-1075(-)
MVLEHGLRSLRCASRVRDLLVVIFEKLQGWIALQGVGNPAAVVPLVGRIWLRSEAEHTGYVDYLQRSIDGSGRTRAEVRGPGSRHIEVTHLEPIRCDNAILVAIAHVILHLLRQACHDDIVHLEACEELVVTVYPTVDLGAALRRADTIRRIQIVDRLQALPATAPLIPNRVIVDVACRQVMKRVQDFDAVVQISETTIHIATSDLQAKPCRRNDCRDQLLNSEQVQVADNLPEVILALARLLSAIILGGEAGAVAHPEVARLVVE